MTHGLLLGHSHMGCIQKAVADLGPRAAADHPLPAAALRDLFHFPAYEILAGPQARGGYLAADLAADLRSVRDSGVGL